MKKHGKRQKRSELSETWLRLSRARFDPTEGSEIKKTRPAMIIQNDVRNRISNITILAAITSSFRMPLHRTNVLIKAPEAGLSADSVVRLDQIRSVDKERLLKPRSSEAGDRFQGR